MDDAAELNVVGISNALIEDLPVRAGACREAKSIWTKDFRSQQEAQKRWTEEAPAAYDMRNDLLAAFRFAFRKDEALLGRVSAIADGTGHDDMIQDLNDIAVLGRENATELEAIGFDLKELDDAAARADELAEVLADANGDKEKQNQSKVIRDKAYTHLKELVDEIREAGKFALRKNKNRLKGYSSSYIRKKNSIQNKADDDSPATDE